MPVEGAVGGSGTATHRLANRAQRRAGERRAPGSRLCLQGGAGHAYKTASNPEMGMLRSYHPEHTGSHQNSEVKLDWAGLVLC